MNDLKLAPARTITDDYEKHAVCLVITLNNIDDEKKNFHLGIWKFFSSAPVFMSKTTSSEVR